MPDDEFDFDDSLGVAEKTLEQLSDDLDRKPFEPVSLDDLRILRDDHGEVVALDVLSPMEGTPIRMLPISIRDRLTYKIKVTDDMKIEDYPISMKHKIIRNHIVDPSFKDVTEAELKRDFGYTTIDDLATAVLMYSRDIFRRPLVIQAKERANGKKAGKAKAPPKKQKK